MTHNELVQYTKRRLVAERGPEWARRTLEIAAAIPAALHALGLQVSADRNLSAELTQTYSVTLSSGVGSLLGATGSRSSLTGDILLERKLISVVDNNGNGNLLRELPTLNEFRQPAPLTFGYFHVELGNIMTRAINVDVQGPSGITGATSPVIVTAHYWPKTVALVPSELEQRCVDILASIVGAKPFLPSVAQDYMAPAAPMQQ